jgi:hypothetical protein
LQFQVCDLRPCSILSIHRPISYTSFASNTFPEAHAQETPGHRFFYSSVLAVPQLGPCDNIYWAEDMYDEFSTEATLQRHTDSAD